MTTDLELHYESCGTGSPILLLHGFGASIYTWRYLVAPLAARHRLLMLDLKGFGKSPKPRDGRYEAQDQADLILKFVCDHGLKNLTLMGHSFGGGVALISALRLIKERPEVLKRLVLIDAASYEQDLPYFIDVLRIPVLGPLATWLVPNKQKVRMVLGTSYYDESKINDRQVQAYAAPLASEGGIYALSRTAKSMVPANIEEVSNRYKEINVPTLILWGRQDAVTPLQLGERLHKDIAGSQLVVIENCGHIPHEEVPAEAIESIIPFLNEHPTAGESGAELLI